MFSSPLNVIGAVLSIFLIFSLQSAQAHENRWIQWQVNFEGSQLLVIVPSDLSKHKERVEWLVEMADRSTKTTNPLYEDPDGLITPGDVVVVTKSLLLWFDKTISSSVYINGGGGMLRGLWPISIDNSHHLNFSDIRNASNYAPNYFLAGSTPTMEGGGISFLGNYVNIDNGLVLSVESDPNAIISPVTGMSIGEGQFKEEDGVFVQFLGHVCTSPIVPKGSDSLYDTDARPGVEGRTSYTLTYRIPAKGNEFRQEATFFVTENNFGPLATWVVSHNLPGYDGHEVKYGVIPSLSRGKIENEKTKYYSQKGKDIRFYRLPWQKHSHVEWSETPLGTGEMLSFGLPHISPNIKFLEFRPVKKYLPEKIKSLYALQAIDNQAITHERGNALDLQLFDSNRGHKEITWESGEKFSVVIDYSLR